MIICYGDSNTWGYNPKPPFSRYDDADVYVSILREKLSKYDENITVLNEGIPGRAITSDIHPPFMDGYGDLVRLLDGLKSKVDVFIVTLGTNDFKMNLTVEEVLQGLIKMLNLLRNNRHMGEIIVVVPPPLRALDYENMPAGQIPYELFQNTPFQVSESELFFESVKEYLEELQDNRMGLINMHEYVETSSYDGIHLSKESHAKHAQVLFDFIKTLPNFNQK